MITHVIFVVAAELAVEVMTDVKVAPVDVRIGVNDVPVDVMDITVDVVETTDDVAVVDVVVVVDVVAQTLGDVMTVKETQY